MKANPGLRVPGAFNGFEMGVRAILGQQVTVKAATTIAGRLVGAFGEPIATPFADAHPPDARRRRAWPARSVDDLAALGIPGARCKSLIALAQAQVSGALPLDGGVHPDPDAAIARLAALPRHRPLDRALHRDARAALARRVSRRATSPCATTSAASRPGEADEMSAGLAPLAQLRRPAYLETPGPARRQTAVGPGDFPGDRGSPAALSKHFHETPREPHAKRHQHQRQQRLRQCLPAWV